VISDIDPPFGTTRGVTLVTIFGDRFPSNPVVLFDNAAVPLRSAGPNRLVVVTNSHATGSVSVTVVGPDGTRVTRTNFFRFVPPQEERRLQRTPRALPFYP
jgi:hypothetical protein